jgi:undecaprenyl-diphosphatase
MLVTVAARLPVEWLLKEIVQRPRPSGARLVAGTGFAYPSGHVLAAAATWGLVPIIGGLYLKRRWLWWALSALTWTLIGAIAWTRVWLGVHWTSDVIGGLAIAFVALSLAEHTLDRRHADGGSSRCAGQAAAPDATRAPVGLPSRGTAPPRPEHQART